MLRIICPTLRSVIKATQGLKRTGRSSKSSKTQKALHGVALHGVAPVYLCELITKHEHASVCTRRAQVCFLLAIPPISKTCAVSFFERSILCAAPTLWNKLSIDIRMLEFDQFKSS